LFSGHTREESFAFSYSVAKRLFEEVKTSTISCIGL